jgi:hypothetical protein
VPACSVCGLDVPPTTRSLPVAGEPRSRRTPSGNRWRGRAPVRAEFRLPGAKSFRFGRIEAACCLHQRIALHRAAGELWCVSHESAVRLRQCWRACCRCHCQRAQLPVGPFHPRPQLNRHAAHQRTADGAPIHPNLRLQPCSSIPPSICFISSDSTGWPRIRNKDFRSGLGILRLAQPFGPARPLQDEIAERHGCWAR